MAEGYENEVVFMRDAHNDEKERPEQEDIWDDTLLIKAYDEALIKVKKARDQDNESANTDEQTENKKKGKKSNRRREKRKAKRKWRVGDTCCAVFSEDGLVYKGSILSIDDEAETCLVRYSDYGNEEIQQLSDLLPNNYTDTKKGDTSVSENDAGMDWSHQSPSQNTSSKNRKSKGKSKNSNAGSHQPFMPFQWGAPSGSSPFAMPPLPSPWPFSSHASQSQPMVPPPPPPVIGNTAKDLDNEALCSMLMAWYMSGYHTGYYQGLKDGRSKPI